MRKKLVSVIIPVYNAEKYLSVAIDSVLNQTYHFFEVILIDDGSSDTSGKICDDYSKKYNNVFVYHINNSGAGNARNFGIKQSNGDYFAFVDSDDYLEPDFLETAISNINSCDLYISGITMHSFESIKTYSSLISKKIDKKSFLENVDLLIPKILICLPSSKLFKRDIVLDNNITFGSNMKCGEDTYFNLNYLKYCNLIMVDDKPLYKYLRRPDSLFSSYNPTYFENNILVFRIWLNLLKESHCDERIISWLYNDFAQIILGGVHHSFNHRRNSKENKQAIKRAYDTITEFSLIKHIKNKTLRFLFKNKMLFFILVIFKFRYLLRK